MASGANALSVSGLSKSFGALVVIENVSFEVAAHSALGIIGPNGAGKTTLFNLVTGTLKPDSGRIAAFGQDISSHDARRRCHLGIARSFQIPQPFSGLTAFENVLIAAAYGRGLSEHAARPFAAQALDETGLSHVSNRLAGSLTLLDRKRLELARALATGPKLLMLDEIAGGLTEAECHELVGLIRNIRSSGATIIWIEHVLHALLAVVDKVMVLDFGKVIAEGAPEAIMKDPQVAAVYLGPDAELLEQAHG
jgi:branched-chain amino acid transport system ATP-binding protein